jgi:hypothetical protein
MITIRPAEALTRCTRLVGGFFCARGPHPKSGCDRRRSSRPLPGRGQDRAPGRRRDERGLPVEVPGPPVACSSPHRRSHPRRESRRRHQWAPNWPAGRRASSLRIRPRSNRSPPREDGSAHAIRSRPAYESWRSGRRGGVTPPWARSLQSSTRWAPPCGGDCRFNRIHAHLENNRDGHRFSALRWNASAASAARNSRLAGPDLLHTTPEGPPEPAAREVLRGASSASRLVLPPGWGGVAEFPSFPKYALSQRQPRRLAEPPTDPPPRGMRVH